MPFIIAHRDSCDIALGGPTESRPVSGTGAFIRLIDVARPCSCGGQRVNVSLRSPDDPDYFPMAIHGSPELFPEAAAAVKAKAKAE